MWTHTERAPQEQPLSGGAVSATLASTADESGVATSLGRASTAAASVVASPPAASWPAPASGSVSTSSVPGIVTAESTEQPTASGIPSASAKNLMPWTVSLPRMPACRRARLESRPKSCYAATVGE